MGKWSLMGGFVQEDESVDAAAKRVLAELTGLETVSYTHLKVNEYIKQPTTSIWQASWKDFANLTTPIRFYLPSAY